MNVIKQFTKYLLNQKNIVMLIFASLILVGQFVTLSGILSQNVSTYSIVSTKSNDASRAIKTTLDTRWWRSNHFAAYGNFYFRLAHTVSKISPFSLINENFTKEEQDEVSAHFGLLSISLISLYILAYFLSSLLYINLSTKLLMTSLFVSAFLQNSTWTEYLLTAHPDILLSLLCAVSLYRLYCWKQFEANRTYFFIAAFCWGLATATKFSTVLLIPPLLFFFVPSFRTLSFIHFFCFLFLAFISYLIIGFPQNFGFYRHIDFLLYESTKSRPANLESFWGYLKLFFDQSLYPFLLIIIAKLTSSIDLKSSANRLIAKRCTILFFIVSLMILFSRNMITVHEHHVMPYIGIFCVFTIITFPRLFLKSFGSKYETLIVLTIFILWSIIIGLVPTTLARYTLSNNSCKSESIFVLNRIKHAQKSQQRVIIDPYIPTNRSHSDFIDFEWGIYWDKVKQNTTLIVLNNRFYSRFLFDNPNLSEKEKINLNKKIEFYKLFHNQNKIVSPMSDSWEKIYTDNCFQEIWEKKQ
jgi:hypothetical protein